MSRDSPANPVTKGKTQTVVRLIPCPFLALFTREHISLAKVYSVTGTSFSHRHRAVSVFFITEAMSWGLADSAALC